MQEPALQIHTSQALMDVGQGYRFAALPEPSANIVWLDVRYPVGFANDPPDKPGLAHLVEHLLFDVELDRDGHKRAVDAELRRLALAFNAVTTEDFTTYRTMLMPEHLDEVLQVERERLEVGCAGLTPEAFARERAVVVREMQTVVEPDELRVDKTLRAIVYPQGHPYRSSATAASVAKLELADACQFLAGPYRRGEVLIVASGGIDQPRLTRAAHVFSHLPPRAPLPRPELAPAVLTGHATMLNLHLRAPRLVTLWALPPGDSRAYRMMRLVEWLLPYQINTAHPGYNARVSQIGGAYAPVLTLTLTLHEENESYAAVDAVKEAVDKLEVALDRASPTAPAWKALWQASAASVLADWDQLDRRSATFANYLDHGHGSDYLFDRLHELSTTVPAQAALSARMVFDRARMRVILLQASGGVRPLAEPSAEVSAHFGELGEAHDPRVDPATADQPLPVPSLPPAHHAERLRLASGLSVVLWPYGGTPVVRGALVLDAGWINDSLGEEGITRLVADSQGGALTPDHLVIGASPSLVSRAETLVKDLGAALHTHLRLRDGAKGRIHKALVRSQSTAKFDLDVRTALYGAQHVYARKGATEDSITAIDDQALQRWTARHLTAGNATLIITGQFDANDVKGKLGAIAGTDAGTPQSSRDVLDVAQPTQAWIAGRGKKDDPSLLLQVSFVGGRGIDADHAKRLVLEEVLSEKLFDLRERTALSYITQATYAPRRAGGLWTLTTVVERERAAEGGTALAELLAQLRRDPESYRAAFVLARQKVLERMIANTGSSEQALARLIDSARFDLDDDRHDRLIGEVASLTLSTFHAFVAREFAQTGQVFSAYGSGEAVDTALAAARQASQGPAVGANEKAAGS